MKNFGSIMDFTAERNAELMKAYKQILRDYDFVVASDIFAKIAELPSPRFWVSEERAAIEVSRILRGKPFSRMRENRREMFQEIFRRYIKLRKIYPDKTMGSLSVKSSTSPLQNSTSLPELSPRLSTE